MDSSMDPSKDGPAIELSDRDPETAPPGGHSGDNNTATKSVTNVMEANENGNVDTGFRMSARHYWALLSLASMWVGAQAPLFLFAAVPVYIYRDLGGQDHWAWLASANLIATAGVSPFVGTLSDRFGRRNIALVGSFFIFAGQLVCGLANSMNLFIGGMAISGIGTGISELTVLAAVADIVPTSMRGYYTAGVILFVAPLVPSVMYGQFIASSSTWRHIAWITGGLPVVSFFSTLIFYHPLAPAAPPDSEGRFGFLKGIDYIGGSLSLAGLALFEFALLSGGYISPWSDALVLSTLVLGLVFLIGYVAWEMGFLGFLELLRPTTPGWRIVEAPIEMWPTLVITFVSGANFFAVLMIWPGEAYNVYGHDPLGVGLRGLPFALGTFIGCVISLGLLSKFKRHVKWILFGSSVLMTAGCGGLAAARVDNIGIVYFILVLAGLGVGGIVVPASTVATIVCDDSAFATVTAYTIAIRIMGGAIGYAIYFNRFVDKLRPLLGAAVGEACAKVGITNPEVIGEVIQLTAASLVDEIRALPGIDDAKWEIIVDAGQRAYADAYPVVYYISIAFGCSSIIASLFLKDISQYIKDKVPREYE